ncbi:hypothetical protein CL634_06120 [bacterium]|nr:hypothetical protein [bacterium]|tara:strand:- start:226 stop:906 length:681 start_codon:yes stop_codon:yes gene_type:complete
MARLFITPRELDFISDINKEIVKDVIGQKVYYYKVREEYSNVHEIYEEATEKVFDPPIDLDARVEWNQAEVRTNKFGSEEYSTITVYVQYRDVLDKEIDIQEGDFLSYGVTFFEIVKSVIASTIFGQIEYSTGYVLDCKQARIGLIDKTPHGPTDEAYSDPGAVEEVFVQQRGFKENRLGPTGDTRTLIEQGKLDLPISGQPAEVSPRGDAERIPSSFYADEGDNC